jgi:tetratricopeptide (TPR) repeat protein
MTPDVAARSAEAAEAALPGLPGPLVLLARAEVRRGAFADAWAHFERARALSPKSLEAPAALHDFATCALGSGHPTEALAAYRALVPRADLLGDRWEELSIFVEAAALATRESKDSLTEAIGYLTEARRRGTLPGIGDALLSALALALDRAGRSAEAVSVARDASPSWLEGERAATVSGKRSLLSGLPPNEIDAMIAIVAERSDRALALERWQSYLASEAGKAGPFAAHARAHRDALVRGRSGP